MIHAVGPAYFCDADEYPAMDAKLACAYKRSVKLARKHGVKKLGFSLLSAGVFSGQRGLKAILGVAFQAVMETAGEIDVYLIAFQDREQRLLVAVGDRYAAAVAAAADAAVTPAAAAVVEEGGTGGPSTVASQATAVSTTAAALSAAKDPDDAAPPAAAELLTAETAASGVTSGGGGAVDAEPPSSSAAKRVGTGEQPASKRANVEGTVAT